MEDVPLLDVDAVVRRERFELRLALRCRPGEVVGLIGDIGSGKSTALALLAGEVRAGAGHVRVQGEVWDEPAAGRWVPPERRAVAWLRQRPSLVDDVPAVDQVVAAIGAVDDGNGAALAARREAFALLDALGVPTGVASRQGWTLSGGETQRTALAVTFARAAPLVLLDDPFLALDSRTGVAVRRWLVDRLAARTHTTLVVCSDPADTRHLADRVVELG